MSYILAIDPGPQESAVVLYDEDSRLPVEACMLDNYAARHVILSSGAEHIAIEMIQSFGMAVGQSVFETCLEIGRMVEVARRKHVSLVYRKEVKIHLCGSMRAKDANIRQAIIDRYPAEGGGKTPQIGIKSKPGPLYGITSHMWQALGVAITAAEKKEHE